MLRKLLVPSVFLVLLGVGCGADETAVIKEVPSVSATGTDTNASDESERTRRAVTAARYLQDEKFISFLRSLQPSDCKGQTPNVSVVEKDVLGIEQILIIDATSCHTPSSGSDMHFAARKSFGGSYTALKINDHIMVEPGAYLSFEDDRLIHYMNVYKPADPNCCPSGGLDRSRLKWNGSGFVTDEVTHVERLE